jgi:phage replication-related protein YjqB (UPF0714/DUF867 family)
MTTFSASIKKALTSQTDLLNHGEHCSVDPEQLATIGRAVGHQIRVTRDATHRANYTVYEPRQETPETIVRMGAVGRQRLGTTLEFSATVDSQISHPTYTDAQAQANGEFVERLTDNGTHAGLVACAPHGGMIENFTDFQAERVASQLSAKGVSAWRCKGWNSNGAYASWHITSTDISRASFPLLDSIGDRGFAHAVAFHGWIYSHVLVGGAAPMELKLEIQAAIEAALTGSGISVEVTEGGGDFGGDAPTNFVNWLTTGGANGIQIEQGQNALANYWQAIADAVAGVYDLKI